jgi:hypothetical protein
MDRQLKLVYLNIYKEFVNSVDEHNLKHAHSVAKENPTDDNMKLFFGCFEKHLIERIFIKVKENWNNPDYSHIKTRNDLIECICKGGSNIIMKWLIEASSHNASSLQEKKTLEMVASAMHDNYKIHDIMYSIIQRYASTIILKIVAMNNIQQRVGEHIIMPSYSQKIPILYDNINEEFSFNENKNFEHTYIYV